MTHEFDDSQIESMLGRLSGAYPDDNVAYAAVRGRVRQVKRRRAFVASTAACAVLFGLATACWLPVVWIQLRMRDMAVETAMTGAPMLPARYWKYERVWVLLGIPAFASLVIVFWLMVAKPS